MICQLQIQIEKKKKFIGSKCGIETIVVNIVIHTEI